MLDIDRDTKHHLATAHHSDQFEAVRASLKQQTA